MRKKRAEQRITLVDPKHHDVLVSKLINKIMYDGRKSASRKLVYSAFDIIEKKTKKPAVEVFNKALSNIQPLVEVRSRRVGGANYQVPTEVRSDRRISLGLRWLINYSRTRNDKTMAAKLAAEIVAASNGEGSAVKKKEETHKMAEANKAFAHFKW